MNDMLPASMAQYPAFIEAIMSKPESEAVPLIRRLCQADLFFLLRHVCSRPDTEQQWIFDRCREVGANPDGYLDLWAREHFKSSIITFALTIQDILNDPEITVGIFSHSRPIAKAFLRQIKLEFEGNIRLKAWFPEIFFQNPSKESPKWSEDEGIVVKRNGNPKESTIEAWGLVDGQPTSKHYRLMVYDDVVVRDSVTTPEMIAKTTEAWELSRSLSTQGGKTRYAGTRWHFADTYRTMMDRGVAKPRIYPATEDGTVNGKSVLLSEEYLADKRKSFGPYAFSSQLLLNPVADDNQGFKPEWLRTYQQDSHDRGEGFNRYILVDAANEKKKNSDYTAMWVIGLGHDQNYYILDAVRDRLNLTERADILFELHKKWRPLRVGYERYGIMSDVQHIRDRQARENYRFDIQELGGKLGKPERIKRMIPIFEAGRVYMPSNIWRIDYEGKRRDLMQAFIDEEFRAFPVGLHDDMLDALSRVLDDGLNAVWPKQHIESERYKRHYRNEHKGTWMSA